MTAVQEPTKLGKYIYTRRRQLDLTQPELAQQLSANGYECTESAISHWEKGRAAPPIDNPIFARALAIALSVSPGDLLKISGVLAEMTPQTSQEVAAKLSPDVLQMIKEADPKNIKKLEAVIRAILTEFE